MSRKRQTMEFSYKNNIKILMLILLWLLADLVLQQIHSCEFFIIEFSDGLNSYDCIFISLLQSFVIHVNFYVGLLLITCSLVQDNTCTSSIQCLMVNVINKKYTILTLRDFVNWATPVYYYMYLFRNACTKSGSLRFSQFSVC